MATIIHGRSHLAINRTAAQKACIILGVFFILAGLGGIFIPGLMNMHLSLLHNVIHLLSGSLAFYCGYVDNPRKSFVFSLAFGLVYLFLGLMGFIFGRPGYPGVGDMEADENLLRIIPSVLELGTADHAVHLFLGFSFLVSALMTTKQRSTGIVKESYRVNSGDDIKDIKLKRSDLNHPIDRNRQSNFEKRTEMEL
jgi:hypothetical protein